MATPKAQKPNKVDNGPASYGGGSPRVSVNASDLIDSREREKREMQSLNDRLASYIEKVRFLEAQNKKLANDLDGIKNKLGKDSTTIKNTYETELATLRRTLTDAGKNKGDMEIQLHKLQDEFRNLNRKYDDAAKQNDADKDRIDDLNLKLINQDPEMTALRRRAEQLEEDARKLKGDNQRLNKDLQRAKNDLDQELLDKLNAQNQSQNFSEEIDFLRRLHEQETRELANLVARDTTAQNREYFKDELQKAIREIREEYESVNSQTKADLEAQYKYKVTQLQNAYNRDSPQSALQKDEVKRMRQQLGDARDKLTHLEAKNASLGQQLGDLQGQLDDEQRDNQYSLDARDQQILKLRNDAQGLMDELQTLLDTKQTLAAELAIYQKLLDGEDNRQGLKQIVDQAVKTAQGADKPYPSDSSPSPQTIRREVTKEQRTIEASSRTTFQRNAKGNITIMECDPNGRFIVLENTSRNKDESVDEWKLSRKIDGKREIVYTLPPKLTIKASKVCKIWARNQGGVNSPPEQLIFEGEDNWGVGTEVKTVLYNADGEERATLTQRVSTV